MTSLKLVPGALLGVSAAVLALIVLAGPVTAQGSCSSLPGGGSPTCQTSLQVTITPPSAPIQPLIDIAGLPLSIVYSYTPGGIALISTPVSLSVVEAPSWAVVSFSPQVVNIPVEQETGTSTARTAEGTSTMQIAVTIDAPAFKPATIRISAAAGSNGGNLPSTAEATVAMSSGFFSVIDAVPEVTIQTGKPQAQIVYPITVTNFGNGQTKVFFEIVSKPEGGERGYQPVAPPPVILESRQEGGKQTSKTVNMVIQTPFKNGYVNTVGTVSLDVTSNYALNQQVKGDRTLVNTLTTTRGFYVPGFEAFVPLAALGAVALVFGRRPAV